MLKQGHFIGIWLHRVTFYPCLNEFLVYAQESEKQDIKNSFQRGCNSKRGRKTKCAERKEK